MRIEVLDGFDEIGGNKIRVVNKKGDAFLLDFGLNFSKWGEFFEEFVNPRTGKIVHDLLKLKLIPRIDVYRRDLLEERFEDGVRYRFLFLSHGHADHVGFVGLVREDIPFLATSETLAILLVASNVGKHDIKSHLVGKRRKKAGEEEIKNGIREDLFVDAKERLRRSICTLGTKVSSSEKNILPLFGGADGGWCEFGKWFEERKRDFEVKNLKDLWEDEVLVEHVYHSVIGAAGIAVRVDGYWVAYTGDFRMGPENKEEEEYWLKVLGEKRLELSKRSTRFFDAIKDRRPLVLIVEGTRVTRGENTNVTEKDVYENSMKVFRNSKKLIIVDFPVRHLERLFTLLRVCMENGRILVLMPKDYAYLRGVETLEPLWRLSEEEREYIRVYHPGKLEYTGLERDALLEAKENGILIGPEEINERPERYAISAGYFDFPHILDLDENVLNGSAYIHSTSEAYTEEQEIDTRRLIRWLKYFNIHPYGLKVEGDHVIFTKDFHASGHVSPTELENILNNVRPDYILPVHTQDRFWFVQRWGDTVLKERVVVL